MTTRRHRGRPLLLLWRAFTAGGLPTEADLTADAALGPRWAAIRAASAKFLSDASLDELPAADWAHALRAFYEAVVPLPLWADAVARKAGFIRHACAFLKRSPLRAWAKLRQCIEPRQPYFVPELGPAFWSACLQACDPALPSALPTSLEALRVFGSGTTDLRTLILTATRCRQTTPEVAGWHLDFFLTQFVPRFLATPAHDFNLDRLATALRCVRATTPLRDRLKHWRKDHTQRAEACRAALERDDWPALRALLPSELGPPAWQPGTGAALLPWLRELLTAADPLTRLVQSPEIDLPLAIALLHAREPERFPCWPDAARTSFVAALEGQHAAPVQYALYCEAVAGVTHAVRAHPAEIPDLWAACAEPTIDRGVFVGLPDNGFAFLGELATHNERAWMDRQRERYRYAVRDPLRSLCRELDRRYVTPVLLGQRGWELETEARAGRALSSIVRNDFGQGDPYQAVMWIAFYRRACGGKRDDAQFFVRLDATGLEFGWRLGRTARRASRQFRRVVQERGDALFQALAGRDALRHCRFGVGDSLADAKPVHNAAELRAWATGKVLIAGARLPRGSELLTDDALVGEIILTFDRLLPAASAAYDDEPALTDAGFNERQAQAQFTANTGLSGGWLDRVLALLGRKKQLLLQGVPGTGKTHVARELATVLTRGDAAAVRLVQFHPAFAYEDFVEGIKPRTIEVSGRFEVTYPVEDGLLLEFANAARREPARPFVLLIDEINRGNLPRIFGELLYLLEYREQSVRLPTSRREFQLPANLYLIGTMNAADVSITPLDQALRRRFSMVEMPPDAAVLAAWYERHPPIGDELFAAKVVRLFEALNERLTARRGPHAGIGHAHFMCERLDERTLQAIWQSQVLPQLSGRDFSDDPHSYDLATFWNRVSKPPRSAVSS